MLHLLRKIYYRILKAKYIILLLVILFGAFYFFYFRHIDRVEFYRKYHAEVQFVNKLVNIFYLPQTLFPSKLERYDIVVKQKDLDFLNKNLPPLYAGNVLTDQYKVPVVAKFINKGKEYEVKVRYRGLMDNHWRDPQKSWLVTFRKKTGNFEDKRQIHLIIASDRNYLLEELNYYRARKMGLAVPETKFIDLFVNGEGQGVYWLQEDWSNDFLARHNIKGNLYSSIDINQNGEPIKNIFDRASYWEDASGTGNYANLESLLKVINNPSDDYFNKDIADILDLESFYQWQIVVYLTDSIHQAGGHNMRMYFDLNKGKFAFSPWDIAIGEAPPAFDEYNYNLLITRILKNPVFLEERNKRLWDYVGDDKNLADDLRYYDVLDKLTKNDFYKDFKRVDSDFAYRREVSSLRKQIEEKFLSLKNNLKNAKAEAEVKAGQNSAALKIGTDGFSSVKVSEIDIQSDNCAGGFTLYQDADSNGLYDNSDQKVGSFSCRNGLYAIKPDFLIYAVKDASDGQFLKPGYNRVNLLIVPANPADMKLFIKDKFNLKLQNSITGENLANFPLAFVLGNK